MSTDDPRPAGEAHNVVAHNHVSFDIKAVGECPACDQYGRVNWAYPSARAAASGGATDRDRLAAALYEQRKAGALRIEGVTCEDDIPLLLRVLKGESEQWADALLPVVDRIANERAAAELRAIGRAGLAATPGAHPVRVPVGYLFDRADALDPS